MSEFVHQLNVAASKNRELLDTLNQTDYASPALKQNIQYIVDIQSQLANLDKELKRLNAITEDERKDHINYRDSVVKQYAYKIGGHKTKEKFASKQEKEEREFLEAWQREREANEYRVELDSALERAQNARKTQAADVTRHENAQAELDRLYEFLFNGPTPEIPGEDDMEQAVQQTSDWLQQCEMRAGLESHAMTALNKAKSALSSALCSMDEARSHSQMDMLGGGMFSDMMERDALSRAQMSLSSCRRSMDEARSSQPSIAQLSEVNIDQGHMISDVLFDNIFTDMAQHDRIKDSQAQLHQADGHLQSILTEQKQRVQDARSQLQQASNQLNDARKELQRTRSEAFERFAGRGGDSAPPAYTA